MFVGICNASIRDRCVQRARFYWRIVGIEHRQLENARCAAATGGSGRQLEPEWPGGSAGRRVAAESAGGLVKIQPAGQCRAIGQCGRVTGDGVAGLSGKSVGVNTEALAASTVKKLVGHWRDQAGRRDRILEGDSEGVQGGATSAGTVVGSADLDVDELTVGVSTGRSAEGQCVGIEAEPSRQGGAIGQGGRHGDGVVIRVCEGARWEHEALCAAGLPLLIVHCADHRWAAHDSGQGTDDQGVAVGIHRGRRAI